MHYWRSRVQRPTQPRGALLPLLQTQILLVRILTIDAPCSSASDEEPRSRGSEAGLTPAGLASSNPPPTSRDKGREARRPRGALDAKRPSRCLEMASLAPPAPLISHFGAREKATSSFFASPQRLAPEGTRGGFRTQPRPCADGGLFASGRNGSGTGGRRRAWTVAASRQVSSPR